MSLQWPVIYTSGGDMPQDVQTSVRELLNEFGRVVAMRLASVGLPTHASPIFRPFSLVAIRDVDKILAGFSPIEGMATLQYLDHPTMKYAPRALVDFIRNRLGREVSVVVSLPRPDSANRSALVQAAAVQHVNAVESIHSLRKLGDLTGKAQLVPHLRKFLVDHPSYERNVFIMMRFAETDQMKQIHQAIKDALAARGMNAVRADDRDYTGDLWSNIEVYLTGCKYGIAVFEDVDSRDYNPNVSLELGYMMGCQKRTLLLKEKRLPGLPADVVHRLYKPFDIFDIDASIEREVGRWIDVDLGVDLRGA